MPDNSKLPQEQAKACELWEQQQQEILAQQHLGGIEEADEDARAVARSGSAQVKPLLAKLPPAQRIAYGSLVRAFQNFLDVQVSGGYLYLEPYSPGGWGDGGEFASEYFHAHFDMAVAHAILHRTDLPGIYAGGHVDDPPSSTSPPALDEADAKLNAAWKHLAFKLAGGHERAALTKLQNEQRAWLRFRDAFVRFAAAVSPAIPASTWNATLEANRAEELSTLGTMTSSPAEQPYSRARR